MAQAKGKAMLAVVHLILFVGKKHEYIELNGFRELSSNDSCGNFSFPVSVWAPAQTGTIRKYV